MESYFDFKYRDSEYKMKLLLGTFRKESAHNRKISSGDHWLKYRDNYVKWILIPSDWGSGLGLMYNVCPYEGSTCCQCQMVPHKHHFKRERGFCCFHRFVFVFQLQTWFAKWIEIWKRFKDFRQNSQRHLVALCQDGFRVRKSVQFKILIWSYPKDRQWLLKLHFQDDILQKAI